MSQFDTAAAVNRNIEEEEIKSQNEAGEGGERLTAKIMEEPKINNSGSISEDEDAVAEQERAVPVPEPSNPVITNA